jgi:hypothetical protein
VWEIWDDESLLDEGLEDEITDAFEAARFVLENDDD